MFDKATSRHSLNKRKCFSWVQNFIRCFINALIKDWYQKGFWCRKTKDLLLFDSFSELNMHVQTQYTWFPSLFGPTGLWSHRNPLEQKYYPLSGSSFLIRLIRSSDISLNLFCTVITSDMKYSSWISGLMWHEFRSQSLSKSDNVRRMFRLNPTRIAKQSQMKA